MKEKSPKTQYYIGKICVKTQVRRDLDAFTKKDLELNSIRFLITNMGGKSKNLE